MRIAFTGHRNRFAKRQAIENILNQFPGATWIHGGAIGFDSQINCFAISHKIPTQVIRPDYSQFAKAAPLVRNRTIVEQCDLLIALYDGRKTGGTAYTIKYAKKLKKPIILLTCA